MVGAVSHNLDQKGFKTDDRDFAATFAADDVFYSYSVYFSSGDEHSNAGCDFVETRDAKLATAPQTAKAPAYIFTGDYNTYTLVLSK